MQRSNTRWGKEPLRGGTWNTRLLEAMEGRGDPTLKMDCVLSLLHSRRWEYAFLTDLRFYANGEREYEAHGSTWTVVVVIRGKVGIMLGHRLTTMWRKDGAKVYFRVLGISTSRRGGARGLTLVSAYAPVSGPASAGARGRFYDELHHVEQRSRGADNVLVVGGDFNAEVGR